MVQLVMTFCLMVNGGSCVEQRPMLEGLSPMGCMVSAQPLAAEFVRGHPKFALTSFRCEINKPVEKAA